MKITLTKEEMREILRTFMIGMFYENGIIDDDEKENELERYKDSVNLMLKLNILAIKNNVNIDFMEEMPKKGREEILKHLINRRKRTYTSRYWNILEECINDESFMQEFYDNIQE